jgi:hypothetical protein
MESAVERAAEAWFSRIEGQRMDAGRLRPDGALWAWGDLTEHDREGYRAFVRPIVAAALSA